MRSLLEPLRTGVLSGVGALRRSFRAQPTRTTVLCLLAVAVALVPAAQVVCVGHLTDALVSADHRQTVVLLWLLATVGVVGTGRALSDISVTVSQGLSAMLRAHCTDELATALASCSAVELSDPATSTDARAARDAVGEAVIYHADAFVTSLVSVVTVLGLFSATWAINPVPGVALVAAVVPALVAFSALSMNEARVLGPVAEQRKRAEYLVDQLVYQRTATELKALGTGVRVARMAGERSRRAAVIYRGAQNRSAAMIALGGLLTALLLGVALYAAVRSGSVSGAAASVVGVISSMGATADAGYTFGRVMEKGPQVRRYTDFVARHRPRPVEQGPWESPAGRIELRGLSFSYDGSHDVVQDVSLSVRRGEMVALVGANGAGKSTIVGMMVGFLTPREGSVLLDGQDLAAIPVERRMALFGTLTQEFGRYELTLGDVVRLGTPRQDVDDAEVWEALRTAHADDLAARAGGLGTQLGQQWGGRGLSGGQWQRLALARTALRCAPVWVLDEPTSAVDAQTEEQIFRELAAQRSGRITVVVSHRAWTLRHVDRIYVVDSGRVVESGGFEELRGRRGAFARLFGSQLLAEEAAPESGQAPEAAT